MKIQHNELSYNLIRSDRKTISIYVEPDGKIVVRAPIKTEITKIRNIVETKKNWIYESMSEFKILNKTKAQRIFVDGEGFLYLGKSYRLKIINESKKPLTFKGGYFILKEKYTLQARELFIKFYKKNGKDFISDRVAYFSKKIGVVPESINIRKLGNRWASRTKKGLNFHWKLLMAPISIIDYIIVHELAHFIIGNHSPEFWEIVESLIPDFVERKNWLRLNGASLDI